MLLLLLLLLAAFVQQTYFSEIIPGYGGSPIGLTKKNLHFTVRLPFPSSNGWFFTALFRNLKQGRFSRQCICLWIVCHAVIGWVGTVGWGPKIWPTTNCGLYWRDRTHNDNVGSLTDTLRRSSSRDQCIREMFPVTKLSCNANLNR